MKPVLVLRSLRRNRTLDTRADHPTAWQNPILGTNLGNVTPPTRTLLLQKLSLLLALAAGGSCASRPDAGEPASRTALPSRFVNKDGNLQISLLVATASFVPHKQNPKDTIQDDRVIAEVERAFRELGYLRLPISEFRDRLQIQRDRNNHNPPTDYEYARAAKATGANAVLVLDHLDYDGYSTFLWTHRSFTGTARLLDVERVLSNSSELVAGGGPVLWKKEMDVTENQGPDTDIELVIGTMLQLFHDYDQDSVSRVYYNFARGLAQTFAAEVDPDRHFNNPAADGAKLVSDAPKVESVRIPKRTVRDAVLKSRDLLTIEVVGTPHCYAEAILPGLTEPFPLAERSDKPGTYEGNIEIYPGLGENHGGVCVRLRDIQFRYGGMRTSDIIEFRAPELAKNDSLLRVASEAFANLKTTSGALEAGFQLSSGAARPVSGAAVRESTK